MRFRRVAAALGSASVLGLATLLPVSNGTAQSPELAEGMRVFARKCAPCHGEGGKGGGGYSKPLAGMLSVRELGNYISKSMPPGNPAPPAEAAKIAAYMHDAFYSPIAQERNRPARERLSRLTVRQYRNAVSDLVTGFGPAIPVEGGSGLSGAYLKGRRGEKGLDRKDPVIDFDFGNKAPAEGFDPYNFTIHWQGSLIAPETGDYEIMIQSDQAVRLWFNGSRQPVIDAWVRSGNDTDHKATVRLTAGRAYPLRLEFSKSTVGVNNDEERKKTPPGPAFVRLLWSPPKQPLQVIPSLALLPDVHPPVFVVETPFPPDDRSMGYEHGANVSKAWHDATTQAALEVAAHLEQNLQARVGAGPQEREKILAYAGQFVARAFRKPLSEAERAVYVDRQFEGVDPVVGLKRAVVLALKSPRFLYREAGAGKADPYAVASRLSFAFWDTVPDQGLMNAAASGELVKPEGVRAQAERLAAHPRTWRKLRDFLMLWLKVDDIPAIVKEQKRFPGFDALAVADLRTGFEIFLEKTLWNEQADFRRLFLEKTQYLSPRLGRVYGVKVDGPGFQPVVMDGGKRFGVVTSPYVLSRMAYLEHTSPIHRGVLLARNLLGRTLNPPPVAVAPVDAGSQPGMTTRERVALQTKPPACDSCHSLINPLGFTLEGYDAIGRIRTQDNGKGIDASGHFRTRTGALVRMNGAGDLARFLADNEETQLAFIEKLFHHLVKQPARAYGPTTLSRLRQGFAANEYNVRKLMVDSVLATLPPPSASNPR